MLGFCCRLPYRSIRVIDEIPQLSQRQTPHVPVQLYICPQCGQRPHVQAFPSFRSGSLHPGNHCFAFLTQQMLRFALQLAQIEAVLLKIDAGTDTFLQII
ncbi:hypothetical protein D3C72_2241920 [compost metagenome]